MKYLLIIITALLLSSCGGDNADSKVIIYENDFSQNSLSDFIVGEIGSATVIIDQGKLQINPGPNYLNRGYVALNVPEIDSLYSGMLSSNPALITWAFNISNMDGGLNNLFSFHIFSDPDPSNSAAFGYTLDGGGLVGNRMRLFRHALAQSPFGPVLETMVDESDGLGTLPNIGAFKITYDPTSDEWNLYFEQSTTLIDPLTVDTLFGTAINSGFVTEELPYVIFGSQTTGSAFFDNLTVMLEY